MFDYKIITTGFYCFVVLCIGSCSNAVDQSSHEATLYFYDWNTTSRSSLTPELLRELKLVEFKVSSKNQVEELERIIGPQSEFNLPLDLRLMNGRLLIDSNDVDGSTEQYFADQFYICKLEEKTCKKIDEIFRTSIEKYVNKHKRN